MQASETSIRKLIEDRNSMSFLCSNAPIHGPKALGHVMAGRHGLG